MNTTKSQQYATDYHVPIMVDEVLRYLDVKPGGVYVDGTLGGGGHTQAILDASAPNGRVIAIDRDADAREYAKQRLSDYGDRVQIVDGNYGDVGGILERLGQAPVDGLLVDAGISSHQVDTAERGFSFSKPGPLDMRMGADAPTVSEWLDTVDENQLTRALKVYGEVPQARRLARLILAAHSAGELQTTTDLAQICESIGGWAARRSRVHPATLVFQALRIAVNRELEGLENILASLTEVVTPGGRVVFISFHSLEDRMVKKALRDLATSDLPPNLPVPESERPVRAKLLTGKPVTASEDEINFNPRARSAKLRAALVL